jgi:hypothetical protein
VSGTRAGVSAAGRQVLAAAVSIDHDWALPASSEDLLVDALTGLPTEDLEGAYLLACHLREAIACLEIRWRLARPTTTPDAPSDAPGGPR